MSLSTTLMAYVRKNAVLNLAEGQEQGQLTLNSRSELLVAQAMPSLTELVKQGTTFGKLTDAVAVTATGIPTTTAAHMIWNGNISSGKSLILLSVGWYGITSAGAASTFGMVGCLHPLAVTTQTATADTLTAVTSMNGKVYGGLVTTSHTVTVPDNGWWPLPIQSAFPGAGTVTGGLTLYADLKGGVIVPPGCRFSANVTTVGTTATGNMFFLFAEAVLDNEI